MEFRVAKDPRACLDLLVHEVLGRHLLRLSPTNHSEATALILIHATSRVNGINSLLSQATPYPRKPAGGATGLFGLENARIVTPIQCCLLRKAYTTLGLLDVNRCSPARLSNASTFSLLMGISCGRSWFLARWPSIKSDSNRRWVSPWKKNPRFWSVLECLTHPPARRHRLEARRSMESVESRIHGPQKLGDCLTRLAVKLAHLQASSRTVSGRGYHLVTCPWRSLAVLSRIWHSAARTPQLLRSGTRKSSRTLTPQSSLDADGARIRLCT